MEYIDILLLTKSKKNYAYCVAGVDINSGDWVRLVTCDDSTGGVLTDFDMRCEDGYTCEPLDVVRVPIVGPRPVKHQTENLLFDKRFYWLLLGRYSISGLEKSNALKIHDNLFYNNLPYIAADEIENVTHSLLMVRVSELRLYRSENQKMKANFKYNGTCYYNMSMTDPDFFNVDTTKYIGNAVIVMSLAEKPYGDKFYKFVAKIFPL